MFWRVGEVMTLIQECWNERLVFVFGSQKKQAGNWYGITCGWRGWARMGRCSCQLWLAFKKTVCSAARSHHQLLTVDQPTKEDNTTPQDEKIPAESPITVAKLSELRAMRSFLNQLLPFVYVTPQRHKRQPFGVGSH